jgi:osmotically-inducible protein OsmY
MQRASVLLALSLLLGTSFAATADDRFSLVANERPSDIWITAATRMALAETQGVDGPIGSDVVNGAVLLHGMVDDDAEQTRVIAVASRVPGVREIRNVLRVVSREDQNQVAFEDSLVAGRVSIALSHDEMLWDEPVEVHAVSAGVVVLGGEVASPALHEHAIEVASQIDGVRRVASTIRSSDRERDLELWDRAAPAEDVAEPSRFRTALSDAWIQTRLKLALRVDPGIPLTGVDIDTREGIVTLFGSVASQQEKEAASERALDVDGVLVVDNELQVVPPSVAETVETVDASLAREIEERLEGEHLEGAEISIDVANATVRLKGSVANHEDRMKVIMVALTTEGVRGVSDRLDVPSGASG